MNTLSGKTYFAEDPHFESRVAEFLALKVCHLKAEGPHQVVVEQGGGGGGEVGGHQAGERSSFDTEDIFFFFIAILVHHGWFVVEVFHLRF